MPADHGTFEMTKNKQNRYGLGIMKRFIHELTFYGHGGAYDGDAFYCPEKNISVVMSLNQMNTHGKRDQFLRQAIKLVI